jgi:hypothetical protein
MTILWQGDNDMKRLLAMLLALLVLTGCTLVETGGTDPTGDTTGSTETTAPGIYEETGTVEAATDGAVRQYRVDSDCYAVATIGDNVVLFSVGMLRAYSTDALRLLKELPVQTMEFPRYSDVQITPEAMGYYDEAAHAVVILDKGLKEIARVSIPEDVQGGFALADTLDTLYYCTDDAIRGYNLKTGTSHLLRQQSYEAQLLIQNCFGGDILGCEVYTRDRRYTAYISAKTGELLGSSPMSFKLQTGGEYYFLPVNDGEITEYLFGTVGEKPQCLTFADPDGTIHTALSMGGVFTEKHNDSGMTLSYYDLASGKRTALVTIPDAKGSVIDSWADPQTRCLWLLMGGSNGAIALYRWELAESPVDDEVQYTGERYTADNPDYKGLAQCDTDAQALGEKYGVEISVGNAPTGCAYDLTEEFRVLLIQRGLTALDDALARYPEGILSALGRTGRDGVLRLILVRQIAGDRIVHQYWSDGNPCVVIALGDDMTRALDNGLYHVLDTYLFNTTSKLDQWAELNPKGFAYDLNDLDHRDRQEDPNLMGETRAFVDSLSMSYPMEDRAAVFAAAMGQGNAELFSTPVMQKKLLTLCQAIRDSFGWKKSETVYPWEQYLAESIAYKPKDKK